VHRLLLRPIGIGLLSLTRGQHGAKVERARGGRSPNAR
jgi:hypothetical protein